jgi:hypothetical protein
LTAVTTSSVLEQRAITAGRLSSIELNNAHASV